MSCHAHMGRGPILKLVTGREEFLGGEMVEALDFFGFDATVAFSTSYFGGDYGEGNDLVLQAGSQFATRIVPFMRLNPNLGRPAADAVAGLVERGARGIKLHPQIDGFLLNDPKNVRPIMEEAQRFGLVVLFHTGNDGFFNPTLVWDLAMDYPNVKFIVGHSGGYPFDISAHALVRRMDNMWLDTSQLRADRIKVAVRAVGKEKVMFGHDAPYMNPAEELEKIVRFGGLTDDELEAVIGGNIAGLLGVNLEAIDTEPVRYPHADPMVLGGMGERHDPVARLAT